MTKKKFSEEEEGGVATITRENTKVKKPRNYKVLLHNDDYTTMEFVVFILQSIFSKSLPEAQQIMLEVHKNGIGVCGVYSREIAESKAEKVGVLAQQEGFPLKCTIEVE